MRTRDTNKEQKIRKKTIDLIAQHGLDGFSMQKLAKEARVSPATLYIYYKDREDLIQKICTDISNEMLTYSLLNFSPDMSFAEGLRIQWINRAAFYMKYPNEVQFIERIRYTQLYDKVKTAITENFKEAMGQFVKNAIARKELAILSFEVYWSIAFAPLYQLIKFHWQGNSHTNEKFVMTEEIMNKTLERVIRALKP